MTMFKPRSVRRDIIAGLQGRGPFRRRAKPSPLTGKKSPVTKAFELFFSWWPQPKLPTQQPKKPPKDYRLARGRIYTIRPELPRRTQ